MTASPLSVSIDTMFDLEDNLLLFFTGVSRSAGSILEDQNTRTKQSDSEMLNNLHYVKKLGYRSKEALEKGDSRLFGELMHEHWEHKKRRSGGMTIQKSTSGTSWVEERRDRRETCRSGRRRFSDVHGRRAQQIAACNGFGRALRKCGSASISKARRS